MHDEDEEPITRFENEWFALGNDVICTRNMTTVHLAIPDGKRCQLWARSVTHAYEAAKAYDPKEAANILGSPTATAARAYGHQCLLRGHWDDIKLAIMDKWLRVKFDLSNPRLSRILLDTRQRRILAPDPSPYWGWCDGKGWNHLGELMMKIREDLALRKEAEAAEDAARDLKRELDEDEGDQDDRRWRPRPPKTL